MPIRPYLKRHAVSTAFRQGWDKLKNGELLAAAEQAGFDVFLTTDKNMRYQQNLANRRIAIVVLGAQQWPNVSALSAPRSSGLNAAKGGGRAHSICLNPLICSRCHVSSGRTR